ncbi:MAG: NAD(P)/FAD-dependent oxidoreductase [Bacilli bacterium]|nr:NAD(P)/FAD-dependent oxidoreductase [Bacilli bacterium]
MRNKRLIVIGAGPAGLTAAYELLDKSDLYDVVVLEESSYFGGISRTVNYKGNRMDMGGHRFFSKVPEVNDWWNKMLPTQGFMSKDDIILHRRSSIVKGGPDPEKINEVMLIRKRLSRIFFKNKFFDYPVSLKFDTVKNMGLVTTVIVGISYLKSLVFKRKEKTLEDFYINRFGKKLYSMFFENYTENLWGRHPSEISPDWGAQRVKGLSISVIIKDIFEKIVHKKDRKVETSLIEEFFYPKLGPGQLWELVADKVIDKKGVIIKNAKVIKICRNSKRISGVVYLKDGKEIFLKGDYIISSMPIKDLVVGMEKVPKKIMDIACGLPYRDYMTVGVLLDKLNLNNKTGIRTIGNIIPDNWVYVHNKDVKMGRFQIYNNWSPYLVDDIENTVWMGLEYFCNENDQMWSMTDDEFAEMAINELLEMNLIDNTSNVLDYHVERVKKAYPAYFDTYSQIDELIEYLNAIPNLYCVGRNGQHRYNNIDHSMCTSFEAVKNILFNISDKSNIWNVNTEREYHEKFK